jgi:hypothetical protein
MQIRLPVANYPTHSFFKRLDGILSQKVTQYEMATKFELFQRIGKNFFIV